MRDLDALIIEPLGKRHDRAAFSCGLPELDRYLARQAGQDVRRRIARVFVCTTEGSNTILGFYTLSALAINLSSLPEELSRKLPRHPVPCALIGRLAVDQSARGTVWVVCFSSMRSSEPWALVTLWQSMP